MYGKCIGSLLIATCLAVPASAQLPADAVMLDKLKISEKQKTTALDPVTLAEQLWANRFSRNAQT